MFNGRHRRPYVRLRHWGFGLVMNFFTETNFNAKGNIDRLSFFCLFNNVGTGGVTSMPSFLKEFFPTVYDRTQVHKGGDSNYCKYDNQGLQLFTSSLYLAALTATFFASYTTRVLGRKKTMLIAGIFFIVGTVLNASAVSLLMLIIGRIALGCGVGFANQVCLTTPASLHLLLQI